MRNARYALDQGVGTNYEVMARPDFLPENTFFDAAFLFDLIHLILWWSRQIKEGTMGIRFMVVLAGLAWQCYRLEF